MERPDLEGEVAEVKSLYPENDYYDQSSFNAHMEMQDSVEEVATANDIVVVSDTDLDGVGAASVVTAMHDASVGYVPETHNSPTSLNQTISAVGKHADDLAAVYVCDLPPNDSEKYADAVNEVARSTDVYVRDHHDTWSDVDPELFDDGVDVTVINGVSAAEVTYEAAEEFDDESWGEFVRLVTDHDVGATDSDPESTMLADFADAVAPREFVDEAIEVGGKPTAGDRAHEVIEEHREYKETLIECALDRLTVHEDADTMGATVATTYGRGPGSQTWERVREQFDVDVFVFVKPGDKINVRATEEYPVARAVAEMFWGGGHDCEAGARPGMCGNPPSADFGFRNGEIYTDPITWGDHWASHGREMRERAVRAVEIVFENATE